MSPLPFTAREMKRAWQANLKASKYTSPSNAHRLLLFYSIECGLKAVLMKRSSINCTSDLPENIRQAQHDINKLLDFLSAGKSLKLPRYCCMSSIKSAGMEIERRVHPGQVNQMWRYGGQVRIQIDGNGKEISLKDEDLEKHLIKISQWIERELK